MDDFSGLFELLLPEFGPYGADGVEIETGEDGSFRVKALAEGGRVHRETLFVDGETVRCAAGGIELRRSRRVKEPGGGSIRKEALTLWQARDGALVARLSVRRIGWSVLIPYAKGSVEWFRFPQKAP